MEPKYVVIQLKKGYAVQHTRTMSIISTHSSEAQANRVAKVLNGHA